MRYLLLILMFASFAFSQTPAIEPGVSHDLAKWRAEHYSDVRYNLNLTLEKMSPVLKGTIEIRVKVGRKSSPPYKGGVGAALGGRGGSPVILDWRKIKGSESLSTISNVSINGDPVILSSTVLSPGFSRPIVNDEPSKAGTQNEGPPEGATQSAYFDQNEHLVFSDGVVAGENVIKLDFTSPILTSGSAITRYVDKEDGSEYIYSLFVPSDASTAFPVFDQPDLKARFSLRTFIPQDWDIVSNAPEPVKSTKVTGPDFKIIYDNDSEKVYSSSLYPRVINKTGESVFLEVQFIESKPISTYVFAFAAGPWERVSSPLVSSPHVSKGSTSKTDNVEPSLTVGLLTPETNIYVRRSQAAKFKPHAAEVFRLNREGIKYLEQYFDYKFPFPKYDIVLIPEFPFGGMEHAGATFLREASVIFPTEPTANDHISRANLIFHEAAHQWFGDTVTMKWFDDLWLKEGFAEFMAYKTLEKVMPQYNAWKVFYERNKQAAYLTDSTKGTTPIYQEISNLSAAKSAYGNIVYRKAPSFLRQAEFYIGEDKFQTAVRAFLRKHEFGNAGWEDMVTEFENASILPGDQLSSVVSSGDKQRIEDARRSEIRSWANDWVKNPGLDKYRLLSGSILSKHPIQISRYPENPEQGGNGQRFDVLLKSAGDARKIHNLDFHAKTSSMPVSIGSQSLNEIAYIFPNYGDYGYGIFLLDDKSRDYVLKNIQNEKDDFLRSMMWGSLWDSVREAELDPKDYVNLVIRNLGSTALSPGFSRPNASKKPPKGGTQREGPPEGGTQSASEPPKGGTQSATEDESTIQTLLGRVSTALNYYVSDVQRADLAPRFEAMLLDRLQKATTPGQRITYFRAFVNNAVTERDRMALKQMIGDSRPGTGKAPILPLKTKDRFDIVTRLAVIGDPDAKRLLAEIEREETSDEAKRYAYAARAGFNTAETKAKYWNDFVKNREISESWIEAAFIPYNSIGHTALTQPYLERALAELPNLKRSRKIFFINGWLAAFIGGQRDAAALAIVNKFLADNPDLDRDLQLKILENVDTIERALKIRAKYGNK